MRKILFLDAGHSIYDPGAVIRGYRESDLVIAIRNKVELIMPKEIELQIVPDNLGLEQSIDWINDKATDGLAITIHVGVAKNMQFRGEKISNGIKVFYLKGQTNRKLAEVLQKNLVQETGLHSCGVKRDVDSFLGQLQWIREIKMNSFLLETGFITSPKDIKILSTETGQQQIAIGIVKGVCEIFNVDFKIEKKLTNRITAVQYLKKAIELLE